MVPGVLLSAAEQVAGTVVVLAVLQDVFFTVLFPGSGRGCIRRPLARWLWMAFRAVGRRLEPERRRHFLSYCGPVQVTVSLVVWGLLLLLGWAAIYLPALGAGITATEGPTDRSWAAAIYYSGYVLTTLGMGGVAPHDDLYRLLTIAEAGIGFATVTMAVTYFLSVYSALTQRRLSASLLHHRTYGTGDAAVLLAGLAEDGDLRGATDAIMALATSVQQAAETHESYPVLWYFHHRRPYYAVPRVLFLALDTAALLRSALDPVRYRRVVGFPAVAAMEAAAEGLLAELGSTGDRQAAPQDEQAWRRRFADAVRVLGDGGLALRADVPAGSAEYVRLRARWDLALQALSSGMLYDWQDIASGPVG